MHYPALLLAALSCLLVSPLHAEAANPPLTIYVAPAATCPHSGYGRMRTKVAEFDAQKLARKARREGLTVRVVKLAPDEPYRGNLRTSEGLPTAIPIHTPLC